MTPIELTQAAGVVSVEIARIEQAERLLSKIPIEDAHLNVAQARVALAEARTKLGGVKALLVTP